MTPLQRIAMGFVIVVVEAPFGGYDGVPDPLGWALAIWGVLGLRPHLPSGVSLLVPAATALVVSVVSYPPQVSERIISSVGWALSLPQLWFSFALCVVLAPVTGDLGRRFRALRWMFVVLAILPVVAFGGGVDALRGPLAVLVTATYVYLVYLLFRASPRYPTAQAEGAPR